MRGILDARAAGLVERERALLERLDRVLDDLSFTSETRTALRRALQDLNDLFLLVVVGEFNAGKSAVINALLGEPVLEEGVTPTTAHIHIIRYSEHPNRVETPEGIVIVTYPAAWLQNMALVDTPGTNAVIRRHQEITEHFVPRSDLVLFVTSADRPFTESERAFLERIRAWGKKVVFVINKADLFSPEELVEIRRFVEDHARRTLGIEPHIFLVSARQAQEAQSLKGSEREELWHDSGFAALQSYIRETLDEAERLRLKLSSPLGIARRALQEADALVASRLALLQDDVNALDSIDGQLRQYEAEMREQLAYRLSRVDNILHEMARRGSRFFDETLRLARIFDLLNSARLKQEFEQKVIGNLSQEVEAEVSALVDWMVDQEFRQWQAITKHVQDRASHHAVGAWADEETEGFEAKRRTLLSSIGKAAREVLTTYDKDAEVQALVESVQNTLAQTALVEVGAVGLGAIIVALLHGILLDVTGILGAGVIAAAGLYLIPARREKARRELIARVDTLRQDLREVLTQSFENELRRSLDRMRAALGPYARFVRTEQGRLGQIRGELEHIQQELAALEGDILTLGTTS